MNNANPVTPPAARPGIGQQAADTRHRARGVLGGYSGRVSHWMTLVLALVFVMTAAVALYMAMGGLATAGYLLFDEAVWVDAVTNVLLVASYLVWILPLLASVWRLACLMTAPDGAVVDGMAVSVPSATLTELFYPFTSLRAYGRTMAVAMEGLGFTVLTVGVPILLFRLALLPLKLLKGSFPFLYGLAVAALVLICLALGLLAFFLSGKRAGFGYFVFVHEGMTLTDVGRYYRGFKRPLIPAFIQRVSLWGWYALSVVGILVPFLFYTIPYGLCCAAVYSRELTRK